MCVIANYFSKMEEIAILLLDLATLLDKYENAIDLK